MLTTLATAVIGLLTQIVPLVGGASTTIDAILNTLIQLIPAVIQEAEDLIPEVKNIIAALSADPAATTAQLATLASLDAQCDAAFEAAATAAGAAPSSQQP